MFAISNPKQTILYRPYMLAISFNRDQIGTLANIENLFSCDSSRNQSHVPLGRFPFLQAYLVPTERNCKHIWSVLDLRLQAYLVPFETKIASILGPNCNHDCKLI